MSYMQEYEKWLASPALSQQEHAELESIRDDEKEIRERFYGPLEFGTAGLRGTMKVGLHQMNIHVIRWATQGFANVICAEGEEAKRRGVALCMDCRNHSMEFARAAAEVCAANGIHVRIFESLRPTPELSFAVREYGCQAGINVTASHNPKEYNGYKAYWEDGAQIIAPHDVNIINHVNQIKGAEAIKFKGNKDLINIIGSDIDNAFLTAIKGLSLSPESIARHKDLKIVYTPIHGTGVYLIPQSLKNYGFENIIHVPEQDVTSGNFPTVVSPNPEVPSAMAMAIAKAKETGADLVMASDPDADRIGCVLRDAKGEYVLLNGNQIVMILLYYIMTRNAELGKLTGKEYIVKTIVTTETIKSIADKNNIRMYDCYTGFKWIAAVIRDNEGTARYLGGGEESYGFLAEDFARDKDAVSAISLMAEAAAWAKDQGLDFLHLLQDIYIKYGFSRECGVSVVRQGKAGAEEIQAIMRQFRTNPPKEIGGSPVVTIKDYDSLTLTDVAAGTTSKLDMPITSNVLQYFTADGTKISVRPSGTEPKIKFYIEVKGHMDTPADYDKAIAAADAKIETVKKDLGIA